MDESNIANNPALFTEKFLAAMASDDCGDMLKRAAAAGSKVTRRKLREDAISPAVLPYDDVTPADLDRFMGHEEMGIICEMEADIYGAREVSFNDTPDMAPFYGDKYMLIFYTNTTPEFVKNVNQLHTYRGDIREMLTDNMLRDLARNKDVKFFKNVDKIVGIVDGGVSPATGRVQNVVYPGRLTRNNWVSSTLLLGDRELMNGIFITNRRTFAELRRWGREEMGGSFAQDTVMQGAEAFKTSEFGGIKFGVTFKSDIIPNGVIYQFTTPNYLGRAAVFQKPTMYIEKKRDILRISCREIIGCTIANQAGVQKVTLQDVTGPDGGDNRLPAKVI